MPKTRRGGRKNRTRRQLLRLRPIAELKSTGTEDLTQNQFSDELLIDMVRSRAFLYDKSLIEYCDSNMKNNAWMEISSVLGMSPSDCQTRWVYLRQCFNKERQHREQEITSGTANPTRQKWALFDELNFLNHCVSQRKSFSNIGWSNLRESELELLGQTPKSCNPFPVSEVLIFIQNQQNERYQDNIDINNIQEPMAPLVVQIPTFLPSQQATLSPLLRPNSSPLQQSPCSSLRSSPASLSRRTSVSRASTICWNKNLNDQADDTDILIGKLVTAELKKATESRKIILIKKFMQILYSLNGD